MSHDSLQELIVLVLVALILMSVWKQLLLLILALLIAACILGIYQISHFVHR
jgi:hypothetical protein